MSDQINIGSLVADVQLDTTQMVGDIGRAQSALDTIRAKIAAVQAAFEQGHTSLEAYTSQMISLTEELGAVAAAGQAAAAMARQFKLAEIVDKSDIAAIKEATQAIKEYEAANAKVNAALAADAAADVVRELADAWDMVAAAKRHADEMDKADAAQSAREYADALDMVAAAKRHADEMDKADAAEAKAAKLEAEAAAARDLADAWDMVAVAKRHAGEMDKADALEAKAAKLEAEAAAAREYADALDMVAVAKRHADEMDKADAAEAKAAQMRADADAARDLADAKELLAAADRHEAEMARFAAQADQEEIAAIKEATQALNAYNAANEKINAAFSADAAAASRAAQMKLDADAARDLADAKELLAAADQHEAEMARFDAQAAKDLAQAEKEGIAAVRAWEAAQRDAVAAHVELASAAQSVAKALDMDALADSRAKLAGIQQVGGDVAAQFAKGTIDAHQFAHAMSQLDDEAGAVKAKIDQLASSIGAQSAASTKAATSMATAATATKSVAAAQAQMQSRMQMASMAMMQFGYIIDDLQYGFQGIVNNIAPFVYQISAAAGLGPALSSGLAAGIQVTAVAAYQLYKHWDDLMEEMGMGKVRTEAEEMEQLAKKTEKTADEQERLNKAKEKANEIAEMGRKRSKEEEDKTKDVKEAYAEFGDNKQTGFDKVVGGIARTLQAEGAGAQMTEEEKNSLVVDEEARREFLMNGGDPAILEQVQRDKEKKIQERLNKADADTAKGIAQGATRNDDARRALIARARRNPGAFPPEFAAGMEAELPENREAQKQRKIDAKGAKNARDFDIKQDKEREKLDAALDAGDDKLAAKNAKDADKANKKQMTDEEKEAKREHDRRVKEMAQSFMQGPEEANTLRGNFNRESIEKQMIEAGVRAEDARRLGKDVTAKVTEESDKKIEDYAIKHGMSYDDAKQAMIGEAQDKFDNQAATKARKIAPKIDNQTDNMVAAAKASGDPESMNAVRGAISDMLRLKDAADNKKDLTEEEISAATESILKKSNENIDGKINDEVANGPKQDKEKATKSQQFDVKSLADKVQGGVGGQEDEQKKSNTYLKQMVDLLAQRAQNGGAIVTFK